jgi:hypothetical protein
MKKILSLVALGFMLNIGGAFAQVTAEMQLDRDKKSFADARKRESDELSCGPITHPGARKQCVFYRDINDNARKCAQNSLTQNDLTQCRTLYRADIRELEMKPYSWFDDRLATCRTKMTVTEDEYKKLFSKENAAGTFKAADLEQLKIYSFENEGHRRNNRQDFFKQTQDQCIIQTEYYAAGIALINAKIKAKPAPAPVLKVNVKKAIYGENCPAVNKAKMDLASNFKKACDGKDSCTYTINAFGVDGDPAPNCPKDLVVTYSCGSADKTLKIDKEAHGKAAKFECK